MPIGAIIGGIATVAGGAISAFGASKAADAQKDAANKGAQTQLKMFKMAKDTLKPWMKTGKSALGQLANMYGLASPYEGKDGLTGKRQKAFNDKALANFQRSPDYQVARTEGIRALDASAAARGNLLSGGQIKGVMNYGSMLGAQHFGSYLDRLQQIAGMGQSSGAALAGAAIQTGQGVANSQLKAGEAVASGWVGGTNAINSSLGSLTDQYYQGVGMGGSPGSAYSGSLPIYGGQY